MAAARRRAVRRVAVRVVLGTLAVGVVLYGVFHSASGANRTTGPRYQVGQPGIGAPAPAIRLPATSGGEFDLSAQRGKTVLLYFQEGVGCEPCWTQIHDIETHPTALAALGITEIVSITGNSLGDLRQKAADEQLTTPVLSDPDLAVSKTYHANSFGMMGSGADGHTFIVVGADGTIRWRADYGGAPNYTMYVPVNQLVADIHAGLAPA